MNNPMHFSFRNQFHLPEGLRPTPGAKQTMKTTENQISEDIMGPTPEVVEPPALFEYARGYGLWAAHIPDPAYGTDHVRWKWHLASSHLGPQITDRKSL